jgi:hypothetical protein
MPSSTVFRALGDAPISLLALRDLYTYIERAIYIYRCIYIYIQRKYIMPILNSIQSTMWLSDVPTSFARPIYTYIYICKHTYINSPTNTHIWIHTYRISEPIYGIWNASLIGESKAEYKVYIQIYVYICVCMYIHKYTHKHTYMNTYIPYIAYLRYMKSVFNWRIKGGI